MKPQGITPSVVTNAAAMTTVPRLVLLAILTAAFVYVVGSSIVASSHTIPSGGDFIYANANPWNGYRIYLSQAHRGVADNHGCNNFSEGQGSIDLSFEAASGAGTDLVARGYRVRLGQGHYTTNISNSNAWNAHYHIPLHSNAPLSSSSWDCTSPYNLSHSASGTLVFYYPGSTNGSGMASRLNQTISPSSPGKGQDTYKSRSNLAELSQTDAFAAYVESGYHTFGPDKNWIAAEEDWAWRIGYAVDLHLGYP